MKKLTAIAMSCMIAFSGTAAVFAEEEMPASYDYSMMDEALYEGSWINAFDTFDLYLPNDWVITCNGDEGEDEDEDVRFSVGSEDETRGMKILYSEKGVPDLSAFANEIIEQGADFAELVDVNGIQGVAYVIPDDENAAICNALAIPTEDGGMYNVLFFAPQDDEEFNDIGMNIVCSMGIHEE